MEHADLQSLSRTVGAAIDGDKELRRELYDACSTQVVPHVAIIGAMFAGSVSIFQNLSQHPNVFPNLLAHYDRDRALHNRFDAEIDDAVVYFVLYCSELAERGLLEVESEKARQFLASANHLVKAIRRSKE